MGGGGLSGKLITKEKTRGSGAVIGSEGVIRMGSDREKGKKCRAVLPPLISVRRAHSNPGPHYHKTTSFIKAYPVYRFITAPCTQELHIRERHKSRHMLYGGTCR